MDQSANSAGVFDKLADRYQQKYMHLTIYDEGYRDFCEQLPPGRARVLDAACGPGNVSRYLIRQRPDLDLLGIDLSLRMVELARVAVPSARFAVHDCRKIAELHQYFDGIICAFGLPYLSREEAAVFIETVAACLEPGGVFYLSAMMGRSEDSGLERCSTGDQVYVNYYDEQQLVHLLHESGFAIIKRWRMASPSAAPKATTDLIALAKK